MVNKMRLRTSVALPKADQLVLAAICSAADTMRGLFCYANAAMAVFRPGGVLWKTMGYVRGKTPAHNLLFSRLRGCDRQRAARFFDRFDGRFGGAGHLQVQFRADLALGQNAHTVQFAAHEAAVDQHILGDRIFRVDLLGIHELLDQAKVHNGEFLAVGLVEATLGQTLIKRHLAAFVACYGHARTGFLTLDAAPGGLAHAGARATAHAFLAFGCARVVAQFIEFHVASPMPDVTPEARTGQPRRFLVCESGLMTTGGV